MDQFLSGKTALITGGAQGIGWATALALADHGAQVFVCDISVENLELARQMLAELPWTRQIALFQCDVSDQNEIGAWVRQIHAQTGRIDVLVNNAVYVRWAPAAQLSAADYERMMLVGYMGVVFGVQAVLPLMLAAGSGHIVNIGSSAGKLFVSPAMSGYSAVKAAVDAYTQVLQLELARSPVAVSLVRPAAVAGTDFFRKHVDPRLLPRLGDWLPPVTPPQVAAGVLTAIRKRRKIVNVPGYLQLLYLLDALSPGLLRWVMRLGGSGRLDYGSVPWQYRPSSGKKGKGR